MSKENSREREMRRNYTIEEMSRNYIISNAQTKGTHNLHILLTQTGSSMALKLPSYQVKRKP